MQTTPPGGLDKRRGAKVRCTRNSVYSEGECKLTEVRIRPLLTSSGSIRCEIGIMRFPCNEIARSCRVSVTSFPGGRGGSVMSDDFKKQILHRSKMCSCEQLNLRDM